MKLIIGLGNPDEKYRRTRHNLGWRIIDQLVLKYKIGALAEEKKFKAALVIGVYNNEKTILAKPLTYMNNSGQSVKAISSYYKIPPADILVIHDDIDLVLGDMRLQKNRGAAGHKGVQSIIDHLKTKDFSRLRIGILPQDKESINTEKYVLENFTDAEEEIVSSIIKKAAVEISEAF